MSSREYDNITNAFSKLKQDDILWVDGLRENQRVIVINDVPDSDGHIHCEDYVTRTPIWVSEYTKIRAIEFALDGLDDI